MALIISIEGNIGAGKSVLLNEMRKYYERQKINIIYSNNYYYLIIIISFTYLYYKTIDVNIKRNTLCVIVLFSLYSIWKKYNDYKKQKIIPKMVFIEEPIEIWEKIKDKSGKNIIEMYYEDNKKYAFAFQMMTLNTRIKALNKHIMEENTIIILERSIYSDCEIFVKMLYENNIINEIENTIYNMWFEELKNLNLNIEYIYLNSDPIETIKRKNKRNRDGEEKLNMEYLMLCNLYHNKMMSKILPLIEIEIDKYPISNKDKYNEMIKYIFEKINEKYIRTLYKNV